MKKYVWSLVATWIVASTTAFAQDVQTPAPAEPTPVSTTSSQGASTAPSGSSGSHSGIALELQGRLSVLNVLGANQLRGATERPSVLVPFATLGVRMLDTRLFLGIGAGWYSASNKQCDSATDTCDKTKVRGFSLSPTVTYDVLVRGPARLYPIGVFNLGRLGTSKDLPAGGPNTTGHGDFFFGMNVGLGIRAEVLQNFAVGTEWGWGFQRTSFDPGAGKQALFSQGAWGTIFLSARIGL